MQLTRAARSLILSVLGLGLAACDGSSGIVPFAGGPQESENFVIAGSSTVAPFVTTAAEYFGIRSDFSTPVVETTGTGGGFKLLCQGVSRRTSSIASASRPITAGEVEQCAKNGVTELLELEFGSDGIVFINVLDGPEFDLTHRDIYLALAKHIPSGDEFIENPNEFWSEIRPDLPNVRIEVYGPPPTSGTRDALVQLALRSGALTFPQMRRLKQSDRDEFLRLSGTVRTDGRWLDAGENDTQIIQALLRSHGAVGVAGFSYLNQNSDRVKPATINGVLPEFESILSGDYALSRSLYLYVKGAHMREIRAIRAFLEEAFSDEAMGEAGYLVQKGLIPLRTEQLRLVRSKIADFASRSQAS